MSISKLPGHMRSTKLNFSATVLTLLELERENLWKFTALLSEGLAGTAHAPHV